MLPGTIGVLMATEAIKLLLGAGNPLVGRLLTYDSMSMQFQEFKINRDESCIACGSDLKLTGLLLDYEAYAETGHLNLPSR